MNLFQKSIESANLVTASPRSINTQIAKVAYKNSGKVFQKHHYKKHAHEINQLTDIFIMPDSTIRDTTRIIKDVKFHVKKISNTRKYENKLERNWTNGIDKECKTNKTAFIRIGQPDINKNNISLVSERCPNTTCSRMGSEPSCTPETRTYKLPSTANNSIWKSYDVEEAQNILEKKKCWIRLSQQCEGEKTALQKDKIKHRLEELRKKSKAIIKKNVNRKQESRLNKIGLIYPPAVKNNTLKTKVNYVSVESCNKTNLYCIGNSKNCLNKCKESKDIVAGCDTKAKHFEGITHSKSLEARDGTEKNSVASDSKAPQCSKTNHSLKRIGLLRKPETKQHSFGYIKEFSFDKENIALNTMTPILKQCIPTETKIIPTVTDIAKRPCGVKQKSLEITYLKPIAIRNSSEVLQSDDSSKLKSKTNNYVDSPQKNYDTTQCELSNKNYNIPPNDLPHWLKPSAVQIFPYNFIKAVRRKLDALADVKLETAQMNSMHQNNRLNQELLPKKSELARPNTFTESTPGKFYTSEDKKIEFEKSTLNHLIETDKNIFKKSFASNNYSTHTQSEANSNFSSISIHLKPTSYTVNSILSKQSTSEPLSYSEEKASTQPFEDDTTISSSIFNSPERNTCQKNEDVEGYIKEDLQRSVSPLSIQHVEHLMITPSNPLKRAIATMRVNPNRGDTLQCSVSNEQLVDNKSIQQEININQLLEDFNSSLSVVIAVNDRLKTTINKTHEICDIERNIARSMKKKDKSINESDQYTDDFEQNFSQRSHGSNTELKAESRTYINKRNLSNSHKAKKSLQSALKEVKIKENTDFFPENIMPIIQPGANSNLCSPSSGFSQNTKESLLKYEFNESAHEIEKVNKTVKQEILNSEERKSTTYKNLNEAIGDKEEFPQTGSSFGISKSNKRNREQWGSSQLQSVMNGNSTKETMQSSISTTANSNKKKHISVLKNAADPHKHNSLSQYPTPNKNILEILISPNSEFTSTDSLSYSTCCYSNIGLYENFIKNETTKSEHITALLRMREKALFERIKGQIVWLEVQKQRCKSKGLLQQITAIKKKQRGILIKMERKRKEIKRLLQSNSATTSTESSTKCAANKVQLRPTIAREKPSQTSINKLNHKSTQVVLNEKSLGSDHSIPQTSPVNIISKNSRSSSKFNKEASRSESIVRANYALETFRSLEKLLRKRELNLRCRRDHVVRLMHWHRQLDHEEAELIQMEKALLRYNTHKIQSKFIDDKNLIDNNAHANVVPKKGYDNHTKVQRRLDDIRNSLRELNTISSTHTREENNEGSAKERTFKTIDCVRISGSKLNKLWHRLTSHQIEKYKPNMHYQLAKSDLKSLYEAAQIAILNDFARHESRLAADLVKKKITNLSISSSQTSKRKIIDHVSVPSLSLCTSSEPSDEKEESWEETSQKSSLHEKYSPGTVTFHHFASSSSSSILCSSFNQSSEFVFKLSNNKSELNFQPSMKNSLIHQVGLKRSISDTAIYNNNRSLQNNELNILNTCENILRDTSNECAISNEESKIPANNSKPNLNLGALNQLTNSDFNSVCYHFTPALDPSIREFNEKEYMNERPDNQDNLVKFYKSREKCEISNTSKALPHLEREIKKNSFEQQKIQCSALNIPNSNSVKNYKAATSDQNTNAAISPASSLEEIKIDSKCLCTNTEDASVNQSLNERQADSSKQFVNETSSLNSQESATENELLNSYEDDFENTIDDLTQIEDFSLPHFESINNTSSPDEDEDKLNYTKNTNNNSKNIILDKHMQESQKTIDAGQTSSDTTQTQRPASPQPLLSSKDVTRFQKATQSNTPSIASSSVHLMPDIINELELRRCQQILIECEKIKQFESSSTILPYMYVREIPNKPPPPYVPPAHGSPMTTIFPSEERIREISYRRTHELYCELLKTDYISETGEKLASVMEEKITNIYERIILDICREYLEEHNEVLNKGNPVNFYTQLSFFNPPNRLSCIRESVYGEVRRCLAMDRTPHRRTPIYSVYGQRAKRDHIGKIIIQEMYDEDSNWCNFHREENEVVGLIIDEIIGKYVSDIAKEIFFDEGASVSPDKSEQNQ